jgi:iron(II)-dependent oxidoreductase
MRERRPTVADLDYHLTTLFPPVRLRGWLELRYLDMLPDPLWQVAVLTGGALLDDPARRDAAARRCAPSRAVGRTRPGSGVSDPELQRAALGCLTAVGSPGRGRLRRAWTRAAAAPPTTCSTRTRPGAAPRSCCSVRWRWPRERRAARPRAPGEPAALPHLLDPLDEHDLTRQVSPLMSPLVWDLAHIGNFEELWLARAVAGVDPLRAEIDSSTTRSSTRGPSVRRCRSSARRDTGVPVRVRSHVLDVLERTPLEGRPLVQDGFVFGMVVQHEHMHDETILATLQLRGGPRTLPPTSRCLPAAPSRRTTTCSSPAGVRAGDRTDPWALDNERPAHRSPARRSGSTACR